MPIHDFKCRACGEEFEELVRGDDAPACPACGEGGAERLLSPIARPHKFGLRGGDARKSNSSRASREQRRQEGFAKQREQRKQGGG